MARRQGPEEKYYPQVWRFLRRCTSPLPTPREGNTFASRNGLSNRFSHMDQPQYLRHRYEPGSKATPGSTACPSLPAGKDYRKRRELRHSAEKRMPLASWGGNSRDESPRSPTGAKRGPNASETGAYEVENRVRGEFSLLAFSAVPDNLRGKRKGILGHVGRFYELLHILATLSSLSQRMMNVGLFSIDTSISKPLLTWRTRRVSDELYALLKE